MILLQLQLLLMILLLMMNRIVTPMMMILTAGSARPPLPCRALPGQGSGVRPPSRRAPQETKQTSMSCAVFLRTSAAQRIRVQVQNPILKPFLAANKKSLENGVVGRSLQTH